MARAWHLAPALIQLREEVNAAWPNRDKRSDGTIGDAAHSSRESDHNPNSRGSVNAIDFDADGIPVKGLVQYLVGLGRSGKDGGRLNYIISNQVIYSLKDGFKGRPYTGPNPHTGHFHVSLKQTKAAEMNTAPWGVVAWGAGGSGSVKPPTTIDKEEEELMALSKETLDAIGAAVAKAVWGVKTGAVDGKVGQTPLDLIAADKVQDTAQSVKLHELDKKLSALEGKLDQIIKAL